MGYIANVLNIHTARACVIIKPQDRNELTGLEVNGREARFENGGVSRWLEEHTDMSVPERRSFG